MTNNDKLIPHLAKLISQAKDLHYTDRYGAQVQVRIQPLVKIEKMNADAATISKLDDYGVSDALVIGNDAAGTPILLDCATLKTYLLDPGMTAPGQYLKNEIAIKAG